MRNRGLFAVVCFALSAASCMSARNHPALDAAQNAVNGGSAGANGGAGGLQGGDPVVEAYIEYPGPQERWAGPASFVLHVSAKDPHWALIHAAPTWFNEDTEDEGPVEPDKVITKGLSSDYARERLRYLSNAMQMGQDPVFKGCLAPVRVRLIRGDGLFVEKTGCRGESGWPRAASEVVEYFMTAKLRGVVAPGGEAGVPSPLPSPVPAAAAKEVPKELTDAP